MLDGFSFDALTELQLEGMDWYLILARERRELYNIPRVTFSSWKTVAKMTNDISHVSLQRREHDGGGNIYIYIYMP